MNTNSMSNQEIVDTYPDQMASKRPFIYFTKPTSNDGLFDVYIAQNRKIERAKNLDAGEASLTELEIELKGWDEDRLVRHRDVYSIQQLESRGWVEGSILDEDIHIFQRDSIKPKDDVMKKHPRQTPAGLLLTNVDGNFLFRYTSLGRQNPDIPVDSLIDFHISDVTIKDYLEEVEPQVEALVEEVM